MFEGTPDETEEAVCLLDDLSCVVLKFKLAVHPDAEILFQFCCAELTGTHGVHCRVWLISQVHNLTLIGVKAEQPLTGPFY